ncbi:protein FAM180A [Scyliorhinus canicula]|uniref:protein FAM180A n=1 Tax=Scyliorhinus canicula TaxID=7830 RepID=UPI0018F4D111|nr:protein FAM180A [Scyliorhinus canicula]
MRMAVRVVRSLMICLSLAVGLCTAHRLKNDADRIWGPRNKTPVLFHRDVGDTFLMYEFLLGGVTIDDKNIVNLNDEELSSMRSANVFHSIMNAHIPKTPSTIRKWLNDLPSSGESFEMDTFEQLLLASVYTAHRARNSDLTERQAWGDCFCHLVAALTHDLSGKVVRCPTSQTK